MKSTTIAVLVGLVFIFAFSSSSYGDVPQMINYQGKITTPTGALVDTTISMTFAIYTDSIGTDSLWSEMQSSVVVEKGVFSVLLGSINIIPDSIFDGSIRYLGIKVGSDAEMSPRKTMVSVAYAMRAGTVEGTTGGTIHGDVALVDSLADTTFSIVDGDVYAQGDIQSGSSLILKGTQHELVSTIGEMYLGREGGDFGDIKVGIGTTTPDEELHIVGNIKMVDGNQAAGKVLTSDANGVGAWQEGTGGGSDNDWTFRITDTADTTLVTGGKWGISRFGNTLYGNADSTHVNLGVACTTGTSTLNQKYCTVGGGWRNTASGYQATVGGGTNNSATANNATVGGGISNSATANYATVGGGWSNMARDLGATVAGGIDDTASASGATVGGGIHNIASGGDATVAGGYRNTASHGYSSVGGGSENTASGTWATIGGGHKNSAFSEASVGGGEYNTASGSHATVGGGYNNAASENYTTVGGGVSDTASGNRATVAGGGSNSAGGNYSAIGGGSNNRASGDYAIVAGGYRNAASAYHAIVGGGRDNAAIDTFATVGGGFNDTASAEGATVAGGYHNIASGVYASVPGGYSNTAAGDYSFVAGSQVTVDASADYTFAFGRGFTTSTSSAVIFHNSVYPIKVGIGTTSPNVILDVEGTQNVGSASDGIVNIGETSGKHVTLDDNEIHGRNGTSPDDLYINDFGGDVLIAKQGNVGIGTSTPPTKLAVTGLTGTSSYSDLRYNTSTGAFYYYSSSEKYKEEIQPLEEDFNRILQAEPKSFVDKVSGEKNIGFIAEEFDEMGLSNLVTYRDGQPDGLKYELVSIYLLEVVKEQQKRISALEKQLTE